jgi:hypothetical protein
MAGTRRFIRFVLERQHPDSGVKAGLFAAAYGVRDATDTVAAQRERLAEHLAWFERHLPVPPRFNRSTSKGYARRRTRGISWFRDSATEHLARMHALETILEAHGHAVLVVSETRVGYVVYEDTVQVVAEPFSETRTG